MADFKIGDTVRLKSGGPLMTVHSLGKDSEGKLRLNVVWFDKNEAQHHAAFAPGAVEVDDGGPVFGAI